MGSSSGSRPGGPRGAAPPAPGRAALWPRAAGGSAPEGLPFPFLALDRLDLRRLLQDHVRVGAADPEGGDGGAAGSAVCLPGRLLAQQLDLPRLPIDLGGGRVEVQGLRHDPGAHRHCHLDHPGDTGRRLGVADVRLDRAELQWLVSFLAVGGEQGSASIGSPRVVPVPWPSTTSTSFACRRALARAWRITRSCDGPLGAVRPLEAPSWFTAEPLSRARTGWPFRLASERRSKTSTPTPSPQATPSARLGE